jgi:hypothetical protein
MLAKLVSVASIAIAALTTTGCGATVSTYLILSAQAEVDGAEAAEAPKYAAYEYRSAKEYLHKSREEQGYSDFGPSIEYAFKAKEMAERGKERALSSKRRDEPPASTSTIVNEPEPEAVVEPAPANSKPVIIKKVEPPPVTPEPQEVPEVPIVPIQPGQETP